MESEQRSPKRIIRNHSEPEAYDNFTKRTHYGRMDALTIPTLTPPSPLGRERERYIASPIPGRRWRFALGYYRSSFQDCREYGLQSYPVLPNEAMRLARWFKAPVFNVRSIPKLRNEPISLFAPFVCFCVTEKLPNEPNASSLAFFIQ